MTLTRNPWWVAAGLIMLGGLLMANDRKLGYWLALAAAFSPFFLRWLALRGKPLPRLYAYSPSVVPEPDDWDESTVVTGYWFLDATAAWKPPT